MNMKQQNQQTISNLKILSKTLRNTLLEIIELTQSVDNSERCYNDTIKAIKGLKKVTVGAYGCITYNIAIDDVLAAVEGVREGYKYDSYRQN